MPRRPLDPLTSEQQTHILDLVQKKGLMALADRPHDFAQLWFQILLEVLGSLPGASRAGQLLTDLRIGRRPRAEVLMAAKKNAVASGQAALSQPVRARGRMRPTATTAAPMATSPVLTQDQNAALFAQQLEHVRRRLEEREAELDEMRALAAQHAVALASAEARAELAERTLSDLTAEFGKARQGFTSAVEELAGARRHVLLALDSERGRVRDEQERANKAEAELKKARRDMQDVIDAQTRTINGLRASAASGR